MNERRKSTLSRMRWTVWDVPIKLVLMLSVALGLAKCQTIQTIEIRGACSVWNELTYSQSQDSVETIVGIKGNNAARAAYCD